MFFFTTNWSKQLTVVFFMTSFCIGSENGFRCRVCDEGQGPILQEMFVSYIGKFILCLTNVFNKCLDCSSSLFMYNLRVSKDGKLWLVWLLKTNECRSNPETWALWHVKTKRWIWHTLQWKQASWKCLHLVAGLRIVKGCATEGTT